MAVEDVLLARWRQMKEVSEGAKFNPYIWLTHFSAPTPDIPDEVYPELLAVYDIMKTESHDPNNIYNKLYFLDDVDDP